MTWKDIVAYSTVGTLVAASLLGGGYTIRGCVDSKSVVPRRPTLELIESYGKEFDCTVVKQGSDAYIWTTDPADPSKFVLRKIEFAKRVRTTVDNLEVLTGRDVNTEKTRKLKVVGDTVRFSTTAAKEFELESRIGE